MRDVKFWMVVTVTVLSGWVSSDAIELPWSKFSEKKATSWMKAGEYQVYSDQRTQARYYPARIEGRLAGKQVEYRAWFRRFPEKWVSVRAHHGMDSRTFAAYDREYLSQGYVREWMQTFDAPKQRLYQAVWVIRDKPNATR